MGNLVGVGIILLLVGMVLGYLVRCYENAAFNRGVSAGYKTATKEQQEFSRGWNAARCGFHGREDEEE